MRRSAKHSRCASLGTILLSKSEGVEQFLEDEVRRIEAETYQQFKSLVRGLFQGYPNIVQLQQRIHDLREQLWDAPVVETNLMPVRVGRNVGVAHLVHPLQFDLSSAARTLRDRDGHFHRWWAGWAGGGGCGAMGEAALPWLPSRAPRIVFSLSSGCQPMSRAESLLQIFPQPLVFQFGLLQFSLLLPQLLAQTLNLPFHKLQLALKELRESNYWLRLLAKAKRLSPERLSGMQDESNQLRAILSKAVATAKRGANAA